MIRRAPRRIRPAIAAASLLLAACGDEGSGGGGGGPVVEPPALAVALNEIDIFGRDWVELVNPEDEAVDISGWVVSDDPMRDSHRYALPEGTVMEPGDHLLIRSERLPGDGTGLPFGLTFDDEVALLAANGATVDEVQIGDLPEQHTWGRFPDATGRWQPTLPTQGYGNVVPYNLDELLFDPEAVLEVRLELDGAATSALAEQPNVYVRAGFGIDKDGEEIASGETGLRLKGGLSFRPLTGKSSFKMKFHEFDKDARVFGQERITLNSMVDDPTMLRETAAYRLFRDNGVQAARTGYARVSVNGEDFGLYLLLEPYDDVAMATRFGGTKHVYEASVDLYSGQASAFEVDEGDALNREDLEALITVLNDPSDAAWVAKVSGLLDLDAVLRMLAVEIAAGHWDGYAFAANNYYLHATRDGLFTMLPSGLDRTFERTLDADDATSVLAARCAAILACRQRLDEALAEIDLTALDSWVFGVAEVIAPFADEDPRSGTEPSDRQTAVDDLFEYLREGAR